ncbi:MAG: SDR family NAD(P)-dependent oxidoreductase [Actinobacteria bacterium]|nr:SDR family NAD(P)-dependent oxidoreductase [Actinomycetota bacterium]
MAGARVAVITGASSGIGEATARELARRGWLCVLLARRADRLEQVASEIGGEWELCDISSREQVNEVAARVLERHPDVGLLLNNAGMPARGSFLEIDPELVERVIDVNYLGGVWCLRAFLPGLQNAARAGTGSGTGSGTRSGSGLGEAHVVNLVSVAGTVAFAPAGAYAASKHAQLAFSRSTAALLRGSGIGVLTVMPGFVETEGFPQKSVLSSRVLRRFVIEPDEVATKIVDAVGKGKHEITVPWFPYRLISIAQAVVPSVFARFVSASGYRKGV